MTTIPTHLNLVTETSRGKSILIIGILLAIALMIRCGFYPRGGFRNIDEPHYNTSGLMLVEGMNPSFKVAPGAPVVWTGWCYTIFKAAEQYFNPELPEQNIAPKARITAAINAAIFNIYRDSSGLRRVQLIETIALGLLGVYGAARYGLLRGGFAGALLLGGVMAVYPIFVSHSLITTPYIHAWALGACALYLAAAGGGVKRRWAYLFMGAAIASRLEMILFIPLVVWESWSGLPDRKLFQAIKYVLLSIVIALACAPWVMVSFITVIGTVLRERRLAYLYGDFSIYDTFDAITISAGLVPSIFLLLLGIVMGLRWKSSRNYFAWLAIILLLILLTGWNSIGYHTAMQAPILLSILMMSVYGIRAMGAAWQPYLSIVAIAAILAGIYITCCFSDWRAPAGNTQSVASYIENHIIPGSPVYWDARSTQSLLPTQSSADAIWQDCINFQWKRKLGWMMSLPGTSDPSSNLITEPPRALSIDLMPKELGVARAYFILGSRTALTVPRFDIWPRYGNDFRGSISLEARYKRDGGIYVLTTTDPIDQSLGVPLQTFSDPGQAPTYVWVSSLTYVKGKK